MPALSQPTLTTKAFAYSECHTKNHFRQHLQEHRLRHHKLTVPSQTGLASLAYEHNKPGTGEVRIVPSFSNITSTGTGSLCCRTGTVTNGTFKGQVKVKGNNGAISVSWPARRRWQL